MPPASAFSRLRCPHPDCSMTFKSHHGRTYHICAVHISSNNHHVNPQGPRELEPAQADEDSGGFNGDPFAEGEDCTSPDPANANGCGAIRQRIEHPYLAGTSILYFLQFILINH